MAPQRLLHPHSAGAASRVRPAREAVDYRRDRRLAALDRAVGTRPPTGIRNRGAVLFEPCPRSSAG